MAIQDTQELMPLECQVVIKEIIAMEMCAMTMEITLETLVAALQNLDNANNYFRAVLFRMVPKHIKSYSFFK
ncbi:hypothetical protein A5N54_12130 [Streptococcus pneumoniae]|nr:hypothetical protein A5N54_12130 [Streptococcus pneumoniae]